jgi:serine phosphatase RsbU (regulator of sigma subunit)
MVFFDVLGGVLVFILIAFLWNVVIPIHRVTREILNLLTGKAYQRLEPTTIDEIGVMTHFFNEITQDLEKISFDVKERRRMSSELDIAASIQKDVLPKEAPPALGLEIVAKNRPAAAVGGDVFDIIESPDKKNIFIYIGDVTGHGVPAGLVMMMCDTLVRAMVSQNLSDSKQVMQLTNQLLTPRISSRIFMTTIMLRWNKEEQKMYYTGAGHEYILVYRADKEKVDAIPSGGIALGMIPDNSRIIREKPLELNVGDCIVLYSDGITEAKNSAGEMYGMERLADSIKKSGYRPSSANIFDSITKNFQNFVQEYVQIDDITMIVIKYQGKDAIAKKVQLTLGEAEKTGPKRISKLWDWTD